MMRCVCAFLLTLASAASAQEEPFAALGEHEWGRFGLGSWVEKSLRREQGKEAFEGVLRLEMVEKNPQEITLKVEMEAGKERRPIELKKISAAARSLRPEGEEFSRTTEIIEIAGEKHECEVRGFRHTRDQSQVETRVWLCSNRPGIALRSETTATRETRQIRQVRRVLRYDEKVKWGDRELTCQVREEVRSGDGPNYTKTIWECLAIPGGELRSELVQKGKDGDVRVVELIRDYAAKP